MFTHEWIERSQPTNRCYKWQSVRQMRHGWVIWLIAGANHLRACFNNSYSPLHNSSRWVRIAGHPWACVVGFNWRPSTTNFWLDGFCKRLRGGEKLGQGLTSSAAAAAAADGEGIGADPGWWRRLLCPGFVVLVISSRCPITWRVTTGVEWAHPAVAFPSFWPLVVDNRIRTA